jgi:hypothetical protein
LVVQNGRQTDALAWLHHVAMMRWCIDDAMAIVHTCIHACWMQGILCLQLQIKCFGHYKIYKVIIGSAAASWILQPSSGYIILGHIFCLFPLKESHSNLPIHGHWKMALLAAFKLWQDPNIVWIVD